MTSATDRHRRIAVSVPAGEGPESGMKQAAIQLLDARTRTLLRSSLEITSLADLAVKLLRRAALPGPRSYPSDSRAAAKSIRLTVDLPNWRIECDDDGPGLSLSDIETLSSLSAAQRRTRETQDATGTLVQAAQSGHHLAILLAAASLGKVEIWTRSPDRVGICMLSLADESRRLFVPDPQAVTDYEGAQDDLDSALPRGVSTRIIVRDLFYNLPVRRKVERNGPGSAATSSRTSADLAIFDSMRTRARLGEITSAVATQAVPLSGARVELLAVEGNAAASGALGTRASKRLLKVDHSTSLLDRHRQALPSRHSGTEAKTFELEASDVGAGLSCRGFVAISDPSENNAGPGKQHHTLFLNGQLVSDDGSLQEWLQEVVPETSSQTEAAQRPLDGLADRQTGAPPLKVLVERSLSDVLSRTVFGLTAGASNDRSPSKTRGSFTAPRLRGQDGPAKLRFSSVISIRFDPAAASAGNGTEHRLQPVESLLRRALTRSLSDALSGAGVVFLDESKTASPVAQPRSHSDYVSPSRRPTKKQRRVGELVARAPLDDPPDSPPPRIDATPAQGDPTVDLQAQDGGHIASWIDPKSGKRYLIDVRTGNSVSAADLPDAEQDLPDAAAAAEGIICRRTNSEPLLLSRRLQAGAQRGESAWLAEALHGWQNPVFPVATRSDDGDDVAQQVGGDESEIEVISSQAPSEPSPSKRGWQTRRQLAAALPATQLASRFFVEQNKDGPADHHACSQSPQKRAPTGLSDRRLGQMQLSFTAGELKQAVILGQVDRKFIACLLPTRGVSGRATQTLLCIDQHAADGEFCHYVCQSKQRTDLVPHSIRTHSC